MKKTLNMRYGQTFNFLAKLYRHGLLVLLFLCTTLSVKGEHPQNDFVSPLDIPLQVTGTFGELRNNHFHSGIDFRTQQREGLPVFAIADGYVSRVFVSPTGFGKAVYIAHPNGYTSVYAHLLDFYPELESYVREYQYRNETFNLNLYFEGGRFPVEQGQDIGRSGNTGSSMGPHLHFEVRETASQMPINPLFFGFEVKDNIPPTMQSLGVFPGGKDRFTAKPVYHRLRPGKDNHYLLPKDTIVTSHKKTGLGLQVFDRLTGTPNQNGVYTLKLYVNDTLYYYHRTSTFAFSETRFLNAHIDYAGRINDNRFMHRLHLLPNNRFSMYEKIRGKGLIKFSDYNNVKKIRVEAADFHGNISTVNFYLKYDHTANPDVIELPENVHVFPFQKVNRLSADEIKIEFPANAFYDTVYFVYNWTPALNPGVPSAIHHVHQPTVPVNSFFDISIKPHAIRDELKKKAYIAYEDHRGNVHHRNTKIETNGWLSARSRELGKYYIQTDTIPPEIELVNIRERKQMRNEDQIRVRIRDGQSGIDSYRPTINGEWILMEYDAKNDLLTYTFDEDFPTGEHVFHLVVTDNVNNKNSITINFRR